MSYSEMVNYESDRVKEKFNDSMDDSRFVEFDKKTLVTLWKAERSIVNGGMLTTKEVFEIYKSEYKDRHNNHRKQSFFHWLTGELMENEYYRTHDC